MLETLGKEKAEELFASIPAQAQASAGQQAETSPAAAAAQAALEPAHRVSGRQPGNAAPERGKASPSILLDSDAIFSCFSFCKLHLPRAGSGYVIY